MGETPTGRVARTITFGLIMAIVVFMVLTQLRIAPVIATATYISLIGMLALAGALAFGLGGRDVAAEMTRDAYSSARDNSDRVKRDMRLGRDRAERREQDAQTQIQDAPEPQAGARRLT